MFDRNASLAVIPARGGSKRIHDKNIKDLCGKRIIAYTIKAALESGVFSRVVVSTDNVHPVKLLPYSLSKAALIHFSRSIANEYGPKCIRVNCVSLVLLRPILSPMFPKKLKWLLKCRPR